jgi:folate-binding protein YgfZ
LNGYISPLPQEGLLIISGPDTLVFLQGQTTCDTSEISQEQALPGVFCTPGGRVVCDFLLVQLGDDCYGLRMRREIMPHAAATLGKYIVFSKAAIELEQEWQATALWGEDIGSVLEQHYATPPANKFAAASSQGGILVQIDDAGHRFEYYHLGTGQSPFLKALESDLSSGSEAQWQALDIASGIARIESASVEEYVPQTLNYDLTGHISFAKGCYTGQEVVARLHYRGTPKRRAYACEASAAAPVGTEVYSAQSERGIGHVVNSAKHADGRQLLLVAATSSGADQGLHLEGPGGPALSLLELPYALPRD